MLSSTTEGTVLKTRRKPSILSGSPLEITARLEGPSTSCLLSRGDMGTWGEGQAVPTALVNTLTTCLQASIPLLPDLSERPEFHAGSLQSPETLRASPRLQPLRDGLRQVWESSLTAAVSQPDRI